MLYEIKAYMQSTTYEKCWLRVEANSSEEALKLAINYPDECEFIDSKCVDISNNEWVDEDNWEVKEIK